MTAMLGREEGQEPSHLTQRGIRSARLRHDDLRDGWPRRTGRSGASTGWPSAATWMAAGTR